MTRLTLEEEDAGNPCWPFLDSIVACQQGEGEEHRIPRHFRQEEVESHHHHHPVVEGQTHFRLVVAVEQSRLGHEGLAEAVPEIGCCWGQVVEGVENP